MCKVSIVVPVYNVANHLNDCLQSLKNQSLSDVEFILVDDGSTDESLTILQDYAKIDDRMKVISLKQNVGTCVARKRGVEFASGKYIMFLDGDDMLVSDAAETIWNEMERNPADILQFGTFVKYIGEEALKEKENLTNMLLPNLQPYTGNMCEACFLKHRWHFSIWNKAYAADICKKAFSKITEKYIVMAEDIYAFFLISYYSRNYRGIENQLYFYNYGYGITNIRYMDFYQFKKNCSRFEIVDELRRFLLEEGSGEVYFQCYENIKKTLIEDTLYQWMQKVSASDSRACYDYMVKVLGVETVVPFLARKYRNNERDVVKRLTDTDLKTKTGNKVKRIAVYYWRMRAGGAEHVISMLLPLWKSLGYEIVLVTDEEPHEDDYEIDEDIKRIIITHPDENKNWDYQQRACGWKEIISEQHIDTVLYCDCTNKLILWDTCLIKGLGANMIVYAHSMFSGIMWYSLEFASYLPRIYRMLDGVVVLSEVDAAFWRNYCPAYYIPNPIEKIERENRSSLKTKNILWVGRLSKEKQPEDIIEAFRIVHEAEPEAALTLLGGGDDQEYIDFLKTKIRNYEMDNCIKMPGFQKDISIYYQSASVFTMTSWCEAFPLVLIESKEYGIPTVMYDLPNVEMVRQHQGMETVPQGDVLALAKKVLELLRDNELREKMGELAYRSVDEFMSVDLRKQWWELFAKIGTPDLQENQTDEKLSIIMELLFKDMARGMEMYQDILLRHEEVLNRHEEVVNRHEEVVNRHEEVANRHEEVVNRHEEVINQDWAWLKAHEERIEKLENKGIIRRGLRYLKRKIRCQG